MTEKHMQNVFYVIKQDIERSMEMTRENAIMELKIFSGTTRIRFSANFWEALNTAIKALEQEPCEDAVSRKELMGNYNSVETPVGYRKVVDMEVIKNMPPVTPTRKKGKWIFHEKSVSTGFRDLRECSCCRCYFRWEMPRNSYCPNCGAEMESKNEYNRQND